MQVTLSGKKIEADWQFHNRMLREGNHIDFCYSCETATWCKKSNGECLDCHSLDTMSNRIKDGKI